VQIAALEKGSHGAINNRPPESVLGLIPLVIDMLEGREMLIHQSPQRGCPRIAWAVEGQRLDARQRHDRKGTGPVIVYTLSLDHKYTSCQVGYRSPFDNYWRSRRLCRAGGLPGRCSPCGKPVILSAVEIVPIHTSPKRKRGNDLATSLALRASVSLNREQYILPAVRMSQCINSPLGWFFPSFSRRTRPFQLK